MAGRKLQTGGGDSGKLDARLRDYSAVTGISAAAKSLHRRTGNWPIYAAASGAALAMATGASASIISGAYSPIVSVNPGGPTSQVGLIFPGIEVNLHAIAGGSNVALQVQSENIFVSQFASSAKNFALGAPLIRPLSFTTASAHRLVPGAHDVANVRAYQSGSTIGNFVVAGAPGFIGFSAHVGPQTDYGWIEVEFLNNGSGRPYTLEALAFGLDTDSGQTPGSFAAGEGAPEPGTMALAILAAGAAGVVALRRRRKLAEVVSAAD